MRQLVTGTAARATEAAFGENRVSASDSICGKQESSMRNGDSRAHGKNLWLHAPRRRGRLLQSRLYSCMWRWLRCRTSCCGRCCSCWRCCRRRIPPAHGLHRQEG